MLYEEYASEYRAAVESLDLPLPEGASLPENPPAEPESGTQYERGAGEVQAYMFWLAIVELAAVEAHHLGDVEEAQHWVEVAAKFVETDVFNDHNDHEYDASVGTSWFESVITPARAGDLTAMEAEISAGMETV